MAQKEKSTERRVVGTRGRFSDRMRISPFKQGYYGRKGYLPGKRSRRRTTRT